MDDPTLFVSHELRTPLTSIQGVLGLLRAGRLGNLSDEGYRLLELALTSTQRLLRLARAIERDAIPSISLLSPDEIEQLQMENDLHHALVEEQLYLVYQPILEVISGRIVSFEALLRWQHPTRGTISPDVFIPIAERIGIIHQLGGWVLKQACSQLAQWQRQFPERSPISININLSALQILQAGFQKQIQRILQETQIAPETLKLEITETALIENQEVSVHILSQLRSMGIQVYIDDFGKGYSSLARLQELPIDALKIDRTFVHSGYWVINGIIIELASRLGLNVIAEGVETSDEVQALQNLGCQCMQGYFFSKPLDIASVTALLASYSNPFT